jgi:hypothetical protein
VLKTLRRWAIVPGAVALGFGFGSPVLADTYNHSDSRHDVMRVPQQVQAPHNRKSDVTHLRIVHNDKDVRFYVRLRSASMKGIKSREFGVSLKTPKHSYTASFSVFRSGEQDGLFDETAGTFINCDQTTSRHGQAIMLRINRACLGTPRWIRADVGVGTIIGTSDIRSDNALSNNWRRAQADGPFTPRLHSST